VSPWSRAEAEGESFERELFARRARALKPGSVPSLDAVLRAAESRREVAAAGHARGRAFVAMALAAACLVAALTKLPRGEARHGGAAAITRDIDASAGVGGFSPALFAAAAPEPPAGSECTVDDARLAREERACMAPAHLYTPVPFSPAESVAPCDPNESCATEAQ
jgi:hypothetical protein